MSKSKPMATKKQYIIVTILCLILLAIAWAFTSSYLHLKRDTIDHPVTTELRKEVAQTSTKQVYEPTTTNLKKFETALTEKNDVYSVSFLLYSDKCKTCRLHTKELRAYLNSGASNTWIMYVDVHSEFYNTFKKHFEVPEHYKFPANIVFGHQDPVNGQFQIGMFNQMVE